MTLSSAAVEKALKKKGFRFRESGDRIFYFYDGERRTSVRTMVSHGSNHTIGHDLASDIARQMYITSAELRDFVSCTLDYAGYLQILHQRKPNL